MEMYTIGKVARFCHISIKTLRYYDEIGLLKPAFVSPSNNYRYYTQQEIQKISIIKYYKELGFKLESIKEVIAHYELNTLDSYFEDELVRLEKEIEEVKRKYFSIKEWHSLIQQGKQLNLNKEQIVPSIQVMKMPIYETITFSFECDAIATQFIESYYSNAFVDFCRKNHYYTFGPFIVHFDDVKERINKVVKKVQCHSAFYDQGVSEHCKVIGDIQVISYIHKGSYDELPKVYEMIQQWAQLQKLPLRGDSYERYIVDSWSTQDINEYVSEIILPIEME